MTQNYLLLKIMPQCTFLKIQTPFLTLINNIIQEPVD